MNNPNFIVELATLGIIQISGPDAEKFLQGQLTCDVREVTATQSRLGAHCDNKGRILATFRLFNLQKNYYLQLPSNLINHLLTSLKKYAVFSKVSLTDVSHQWRQIGIMGSDNLPTLGIQLPQAIDETICEDEVIIARLPSNAIARFSLLGTHAAIEKIYSDLQNTCQTTDFSTWQIIDIETGIPSLSPETTGLFTPQQINYSAINGVSFNKGCYIGQEIIARMHYLGKQKQRMYKISFVTSSNVTAGAKVLSGTDESVEECGTLVQAINIQAQTWHGLAVIYDKAIKQNLYVENLHIPILDVKDLPYTSN